MSTKERYINLFTDYGFKKIFGEEPNKNLLLDFLNELLRGGQGEIKSLTYLKTEQLGDTDIDRKAIFDLYCENERGEKFSSYEKSLKYYRDMKNSLDTAFDEGKAEGKQEGRAEGREEGEHKKEREVVINGLQQGLDKKVIAALTGLPVEKIAEELSEKKRNTTPIR